MLDRNIKSFEIRELELDPNDPDDARPRRHGTDVVWAARRLLMYRTHMCRGCCVEAKEPAWLITPDGFYCPRCAEALPESALDLCERTGTPDEWSSFRDRVIAGLKSRRDTDERLRAFRLATGHPLPPPWSSEICRAWELKPVGFWRSLLPPFHDHD